jgi:hypothetical protein
VIAIALKLNYTTFIVEIKIVNMRIPKQERQERVLDLYYNQNKTYREIAKLERICPRDIGSIVNKVSKELEPKQSPSKESQAYKMFFESKSPIEVAIALNLREPQVTQLYKECWNLKQLYDLNQIYLENKGDIAPIVMLYRSIKTAGMGISHIIKLLQVANNDLPRLENEYESLREGVNSLEGQYRNSDRKLVELNNQVTEASNYVEHFRTSCRQEEMRLEDLRQKRMNVEALVRQFENNNSEYVKIRKTAEEKVRTVLSDGKPLLSLAIFCLIDSIKEKPDKYSPIICEDMPRITSNYIPYYPFFQ